MVGRARTVVGTMMLCAGSAAGQFIYFTELLDVGEEAIRRIRTDGTDLQTLSSAVGDGLRGIAIDLPRHRVYWSDVDSGEIFRGPIESPGDGEAIVSGLAFPVDIGLTPIANGSHGLAPVRTRRSSRQTLMVTIELCSPPT